MSSAEPLNFGRKIKDLKRLNKKSYSDLCAGLKISRERIIALEENEREPSETERLRFANFYNLPPEEFGLRTKATEAETATETNPNPNVVQARPYPPTPSPNGLGNSNPNYNAPNNVRSNFAPRSASYNNERPNYSNERVPGNERPNFNIERPTPAERSNFGNERSGSGNERSNLGNERTPISQNPNYRGGSNGPRPPLNGGGPNNRPATPARPAQANPGSNIAPKPATTPKPKPEKTEENGDGKPVIKYTAEQLGDIESAYLRKQRDLKVPLKFTFLNGKEYTGVVVDFTPFTVHIIESDTGEEVILRKLAMAYYRKADAVAEAQAEKASAARRAANATEKPLLPTDAESEQ